MATALILPLLLGLGSWQLQRAEEKRGLLAAFEAMRQQPAVDIASLELLPNYRPVYATGELDPQRYWLLDNRIREGRFGYEVVGILTLDDGRELLVDRGWVAADPSRQQLPAIATPEGEQRLVGDLYLSTEKPFSLGPEPVGDRWPQRRQWLDVETLQEAVPTLLPTTLRLRADSPAAFEVDRLVVNVSPETHTGYAVQWFAMALALIITFVCLNSNLPTFIKRKRQKSDS